MAGPFLRPLPLAGWRSSYLARLITLRTPVQIRPLQPARSPRVSQILREVPFRMGRYFFCKGDRMKKSCPYCGGIHDKKTLCSKAPKKSWGERGSREDIFRWSYSWKVKRAYIMRRDKFLCLACLNRFPGTTRRFNSEDLSVHHIRPLKTNWELRLDEKNLLTLCHLHHEMAENGQISAEKMLKILPDIPPEGYFL